MVRVAVITVLVLMGPSAAVAFPCQRPQPPGCAMGAQAFADRTVLVACHREVESYREQVLTYLGCIREEYAQATREMEDVVRLFNCRLAGGGPCPPAPSP